MIEVVNDAPPPGSAIPAAGPGSGTGLLGLAEKMLAGGLSNTELAASLNLSEATVKTT